MRLFDFDEEFVPDQEPVLINMIKDASPRLARIALLARAAFREPLEADRAGDADALVAGILQAFLQWAWDDADECARNLHIVSSGAPPTADEVRELRLLIFAVMVTIVAALAPDGFAGR